ncbi:MAG: hypothetical protein ACR2K2_08590 [Mycobacteriales bacterium]
MPHVVAGTAARLPLEQMDDAIAGNGRLLADLWTDLCADRTGPYAATVAAPEDLESRLSAVERELAQLREQTALAAVDAAAARTLSAGADRDVSEVRAELRAHTSVLHALRETQLDHGGRLDRLEARVDAGFAAADRAFATVNTGMSTILTLLEGLADSGR